MGVLEACVSVWLLYGYVLVLLALCALSQTAVPRQTAVGMVPNELKDMERQ